MRQCGPYPGFEAVQVGLAWADPTGLRDRDHVEGVVGLPVAATVEPNLPCCGARPDRDRRGPGERRIGVLVREPGDVSTLSDQNGR